MSGWMTWLAFLMGAIGGWSIRAMGASADSHDAYKDGFVDGCESTDAACPLGDEHEHYRRD